MENVTPEEVANAYRSLGLRYGELDKYKSRHRALVREFHPDRPDGGDLEKMQEINAAADVLERYGRSFPAEFLDEVPTQKGGYASWEDQTDSSVEQGMRMDFTVYDVGVLWPLIFLWYIMEGFLAIQSWFGS